jgi:hypothetical protein
MKTNLTRFKRRMASFAGMIALVALLPPAQAAQVSRSSARLLYVPIEPSHRYSITVETSHPVELIVTRSPSTDLEMARAFTTGFTLSLGSGSELLNQRYAAVIALGENRLPARASIRVVDERGDVAGTLELQPGAPLNSVTEFYAGLVFVKSAAETENAQIPQ